MKSNNIMALLAIAFVIAVVVGFCSGCAVPENRDDIFDHTKAHATATAQAQSTPTPTSINEQASRLKSARDWLWSATQSVVVFLVFVVVLAIAIPVVGVLAIAGTSTIRFFVSPRNWR